MTQAAATPSRFGPAFELLGVERAWTRTRGAAVIIGIVDHGVQLDHPLIGPNIQKDPALHTLATGDHEIAGTHAAGVAAGRSSEVARFSGVAPDARILAVCFSGNPGTQAFDLPHAIEYAAEMGASIINVSSAADVSKPAAHRAIQYAATRNVLVVCPATSDSSEARHEAEPLPNKITVLSVSEKMTPLTRVSGDAQIAAPGFARVPHWRGSGHTAHEDAAFGASYVSGCAALIKAQNPAWGYLELKEHLLASATILPELEGQCQSARALNIGDAVLGPIGLKPTSLPLRWSSLSDAVLTWDLRYRSAYCGHAVALFRPHGDDHWRELACARVTAQRMTVPGSALRRASGTLRIACRESNFHSEEVPLTIV
jgi:subtilisin family serine protease